MVKNLTASIKSKLKNIAKDSGRRVDAVVLQYFQERLLYRISASKYRDNFILKGALLLLIENISRFRPTKDIDFLGEKLNGSIKNIKQIFREILKIKYNDGVLFDEKSITCEKIKEGTDYEGIRVRLNALLGSLQRNIFLDIGFGDIVTPAPLELKFPVLLENPEPDILCYTYESVIAEKIEAIVKLNFFTSRMKDFYDIIFLSRQMNYDFEKLSKSIMVTFANRNTSLQDIDVIFSEEFISNEEKVIMWNSFLDKNNIEN